MENYYSQNPIIINDAIHKVMNFPRKYHDLIKGIVDSITFQRLRHIKQMGMAELVFPTAVHNRFSHCFGAAYVAYQIAEKVTKRMSLQEDIKDDVIKYALASSLLHDIGHGPFSHAFEKLLIKQGGDEKDKNNTIKHEDWTDHFINDFESVLSHDGIDHKKVSQMIQKKYELKENDPLNIAADITSSQLDADRLDYLLRDSHFCGVPYGHTDITWILNHLVAIDQETGTPPRLGILYKGWQAVEDFLLCRRAMYQNIYNHHKINAIQHLMIEFLKLVSKSLFEEGDNNRTIKYNNTVDQILKNFLVNVHIFRNDSKYTKISFICDNYRYYKILNDNDVWMMINYLARDEKLEISFTNIEIFELAKNLCERKLHKMFRIDPDCIGAVSSIIQNMKKRNNFAYEWELFVVETKNDSYDKFEDPILVANDADQIFRIQKFSPILNQLSILKEHHLAISQRIWEIKKDEIKKSDLSKYIHFPEN